MNNVKPLFLDFYDAIADNEKYPGEIKLEILMKDGTCVYILPPVTERDFFATFDWDLPEEELHDNLVKAADFIDSYVGKNMWEEWNPA